MKRDQRNPIIRWRDRQPGDTAPEDRAAKLVRDALVPSEPDGLWLTRIRQNLHAREGRRGRSSLVSRLAFAAVFLIAGVATARAYELARKAGWFERSRPVQATSKPTGHSPSPRRSGRSLGHAPGLATDPASIPVGPDQQGTNPAAGLSISEPTGRGQDVAVAPSAPQRSVPPTVPLPAVDHARPPTHPTRRPTSLNASPLATVSSDPGHRGSRPTFESMAMPSVGHEPQPLAAPPATPPPALEAKPPAVAPATGASEETRALDKAIGLLRRERNPAAALPILDGYLGRNPRGLLHGEARLARVDALLMLDRPQEALAALEDLPLDKGRRSTELRVVRGELRARVDCARAEEDFTAALAHSPDAGLLERILHGRGVCRAQSGNRAGAMEDLRRYLERFPRGAYAGAVRRWLDAIGSSAGNGG